MEYTTAKRRKDPITFTLDDRVFTFTPPKSALMVMPIIDSDGTNDDVDARATFDWLGAGLGDEDIEYLKARLRDPEDDFDIEAPDDEVSLTKIVTDLTKQLAGRPTT